MRATPLTRIATLAFVGLLVPSCSGNAQDDQQAVVEEDHRTLPEGSVLLADAATDLVEKCEAAADVLDFEVPCPTRLPEESSTSCSVPSATPDTPDVPCVWGEGFYFSPGVPSRALPPSYSGTAPGSMHLVFIASLEGRPCNGDGSRSEPVQVREREARMYWCSEFEGLHADHVVLEWQERGVVVGVSVHGHNEANVQLLYDLADGIKFVAPAD